MKIGPVLRRPTIVEMTMRVNTFALFHSFFSARKGRGSSMSGVMMRAVVKGVCQKTADDAESLDEISRLGCVLAVVFGGC